MIGWTNPAALWALVVSAAPVIIHLLRRHRAARIPFPSLRFVRPAETSAVRLRRPSDSWLLVLRVAILALFDALASVGNAVASNAAGLYADRLRDPPSDVREVVDEQ